MPQWLQEHLERERQEQRKRQLLATNSNSIWRAILRDIEECARDYNNAYPAGLGQHPAVVLSHDGNDSTTFRLTIDKSRGQKGVVRLEYPINEPCMKVYGSSSAVSWGMDLDIPEGENMSVVEALVLVHENRRYGIADFVQELLEPLFFPSRP